MPRRREVTPQKILSDRLKRNINDSTAIIIKKVRNTGELERDLMLGDKATVNRRGVPGTT